MYSNNTTRDGLQDQNHSIDQGNGFSSRNQAVKSTAALVGPRKQSGAPAKDERDFCLPLFRQAGREGINRLHFLQGTGPLNGRLVTQVGRLINTLEKEGYHFVHEKRRGDRFVTYALVGEPMQPGHPVSKPVKKGWQDRSSYDGQFVYGSKSQYHKDPSPSYTEARNPTPQPPQRQESLFGDVPQTSRFLDFESGKSRAS